MKSEILRDNGWSGTTMEDCISFVEDWTCPCNGCTRPTAGTTDCSCGEYRDWKNKRKSDDEVY